LDEFVTEEVPKLGTVEASEKPFELGITNLDIPLVGVIDLVTARDGLRRVTDFKTAGRTYQEHEVALSDQLSAYHAAVPTAEEFALCVFVKTREPRIDWYVGSRNGKSLTDFLEKAALISNEIRSLHFYRRPGRWCAQCDFLPICMGDRAKANLSLIQLPS
jgi:MoaA/NifB/PqqE/SkfB family radical SAM enzyme